MRVVRLWKGGWNLRGCLNESARYLLLQERGVPNILEAQVLEITGPKG